MATSTDKPPYLDVRRPVEARAADLASRLTLEEKVALMAGAAAFTLEDGGWVALDSAPASGAAVTAGFGFDVPVRFAEDTLSVSRSTFLAGAAASVPLIEVRED